MDTVETTEPAGSDGATSSPDTSQVDTQTAEPTEPSAGEVGEAEQTETLLAGKYKNVEELEKAHKELEGKLGSLGQKAKVADLIQEKYGMTPDQLQQTIEAEEQARMAQQYQANPGAFAVQKVQELEAKLALQAEEKELDSFLSKNPEYEANREQIFKLGLHLEKDKTYEEIAREYFGETRAQGQQDAYKKIEMKTKTQATGTKSTPSRGFTEAEKDAMSSEELAKILPHADTSQRLVG